MEVTENIHQVDNVNANVYLIVNGRELNIIDTGMPRNSRKITDYIRKIGRQPSDTANILLTHFHIDHVGSANELKTHRCKNSST